MAQKKRVLFVAQPTVAGVAQCVVDWAQGLRSCDWEVSLACPDDGWLSGRAQDLGIRTSRWDAVKQPHRGVPRELRQLSAIVDQIVPDVLHLHGSNAGMIGRLVARGRIPTAFSPHSWSFQAATGAPGRAALQWERLAARWTSVFVCVSEQEAEDGRARGIRGTYVTARNGVDTAMIKPLDPSDRARLRQAKGMGQGEVCVVCVGRVHRQKGQDVLLQAWSELDAANARLVIVGDGPLLSELSGTSVPRVRFTGGADRPEAIRWMQAADIVVMPSRWEGMALVPLESLAVGTPVIASDVTGVREAVGPECGELVAPEDPAALASALSAWMPRVAMDEGLIRRAARQRVLGRFELSDTIATLDGTLRGLADS